MYDCNNPAHWDGETMYVISSSMHPYRGHGRDVFRLQRPSVRIVYDDEESWDQGGRWIEATWKDPRGPLYGWYHNEPPDVCPGKPLTAPRIGAAISHDNGVHWKDLGIILEAPPDSLACETHNGYFAGGNGDFCVNLDRDGRYFYLLIGTYHANVLQQGVAVARMRFEDRDDPVGKVFKWRDGRWDAPGLGGELTPIFAVKKDWNDEVVDAFWGPSVHWNTYLDCWVMLLNRARDKEWSQEGVYISYNRDIASPKGWSEPVRIYDGRDHGEGARHWWYPQVIGINREQRETDKLASRVARFFVRGRSQWQIVFLRPGEQAE